MRNVLFNSQPVVLRRAKIVVPELSFKKLTPDSIDELRPLLRDSHTRANDFTIGGLLMWTDYFHYEYCIYRGTLFIKGVSEIHTALPAFSLPVGALPLSESVGLIVAYCHANNIPLRFSAVPSDRVDEIREIIAGQEERLTDWSDYIYDAQELASLSGKKFNKKRNHVNRFIADNQDYRVERLSRENLTEVRNSYTRWLTEGTIETASATEESIQTLRIIDNYEQYPFEGILLRDNAGEIVAFTMGEVIGDTLYSHIEKMNHHVTGAGETINKLFAQHITSLYPQVMYINREEDAGDLGLRQAKLSYNPVMILEKYDIIV